MTVLWNSAAFSADQRADALRETIRSNVVCVELDLPATADQVQAKVALSDLARVQLCSVDAMPTTVTRTSRSARAIDEEPVLFVTLQVAGTSMMVQHGRQAVLQPGQFAVYATTAPYTLVFGSGVHAHFFRIPLSELALPDAAVREVSARTLGGPDEHVARLTSSYLTRIAATAELLARPTSDSLATPTIELVRTTLATARGDEALVRGPAAASLDVRIVEHMRANLRDPSLSAATIAAAHHVSVRHLYTLLSRAGISLGDWIRTERLERCRRDLAQPGLSNLTIAAIATSWGFADATHFSRVFRDAYGLSPRQWRTIRLTPPR
jgi:AraC-like DNA-binding protein